MPFIDPSCKLWCILRDDVGIAPRKNYARTRNLRITPVPNIDKPRQIVYYDIS